MSFDVVSRSIEQNLSPVRDNGRIIHIGSTNSDRMPFVGGSVYALTKAAVAGFIKGLRVI